MINGVMAKFIYNNAITSLFDLHINILHLAFSLHGVVVLVHMVSYYVLRVSSFLDCTA